MKLRKTVLTLLAVGAMLAFTLGSITPAIAAGKKTDTKKVSEKVKKSTKKAKTKAQHKVAKELPKGKININTASKDELTILI